ncbi:hypothetical protein GCM10007173_23630 [Glutamicibacter ardleyensis]|uniref:Uncharacterized protein n=1 Tax=Glutamicibacter ardleyensis TaxID=225894 RepID=A0ABQ2DPC6_9MICC|nr:hypothetical protein GCM10007173_23630 [Glutamicibacter ardleyensis]
MPTVVPVAVLAVSELDEYTTQACLYFSPTSSKEGLTKVGLVIPGISGISCPMAIILRAET